MSEYILPHADGYLKLGQDYDCSDIHLAVNSRPTWRRFGQLLPIWEEAPNLTPQDTEVLARGFLEDPEWNRLQQRGDVDFATPMTLAATAHPWLNSAWAMTSASASSTRGCGPWRK